MLTELDQYSSYISPEELTRFNQQVEQEFGGIGIQVHIDPASRRLTVMTPLPGTPAYKAGVLAGDVIMEIEGESTEGFTIEQAVQRLKGNAGEKVTVGVKHVGTNDVEQISIVRDIIHVATVLGDRYGDGDKWDFMLNDQHKIGYIRLTHFSRHTAEELGAALESLQKQGMQSLVLDLRFNPGGLLSQAIEVSDMFIKEGPIVSTRGRNSRDRVWNATKPGTISDVPMVVLVNRFSASASEIVSACLQDHKRCVVMGERTWGKGSVQNVIELEGGTSALKLTTASYHRPSGKNIHRFKGATAEDEWGVMPDDGYRLRMSNEELQEYLEYRRLRDVVNASGPPESDFEDRQLKAAVDYLTSQVAQKSDKATPAEANKPKNGDSKAEKPGGAEKAKGTSLRTAPGTKVRSFSGTEAPVNRALGQIG